MIATQYSTASEATGCRHSTTVSRVLAIIEWRHPGRFARGTVLGGYTNRIIPAQSPSFYPLATRVTALTSCHYGFDNNPVKLYSWHSAAKSANFPVCGRIFTPKTKAFDP